ncbi:MAG: 4Fe-4S dicluster domain-containing protein, partial [Nitrososphaerota archaeon]
MFIIPKLQLEDIFACAQCGYCVKKCPVYYFLGWESTSPRGKMFTLKEILGNNSRLD